MTKEEAEKLLVDKAGQSFYGKGYGMHIEKAAEAWKRYQITFYGTEEECKGLQEAFAGGSTYKMKNEHNGQRWLWQFWGEKAEKLSIEMKPLLSQGKFEARERVRYCL